MPRSISRRKTSESPLDAVDGFRHLHGNVPNCDVIHEPQMTGPGYTETICQPGQQVGNEFHSGREIGHPPIKSNRH